MPKKTSPQTVVRPQTQRYLEIAEMRDDVVTLKDGTIRAVLAVSSLNFALKSDEEQEAIIQAYVSFLNGLEEPIQIVIQSRKMNIDGYLEDLGIQERRTANPLLKSQMEDYRQFVQELVQMGEIMQKRFYLVVLHEEGEKKKRKSFWVRLSEAISPSAAVRLREEDFQGRREDLFKRVSILQSQLGSMGLGSAVLDTQGLIELFYGCYNPDLYETQKMADLSKVRLET
ncbi:MAG TPA: hypothetical protein VJB99_03795 [Patescibacteria group bacterium]|nr:hypothetical protein [Patescibacteria group bacterium]